MSIPGNANPLLLASAADAAAAAAGPIKSVRFNDDDSAYLNRTPSSAGNRQTWTWSGWVKRSSFGSRQHVFGAVTSGSVFGSFEFNSDDELRFYDNTLGDSSAIVFETGRVFRDPSAWYHIVVALDSTAGTDAARIKLYVNGVQEESSSFSTGPTVAPDGIGLVNSTAGHNVGSWTPASSSLNLNAYLADVYFIDGSQLDPTSFGAFDDNGVWQAAAYSGTFGTNGFHLLDFANEATVGNDSSGNENDFTANNFATDEGVVYSNYIFNETDPNSWRNDNETPDLAFDGSISTAARVEDTNDVILLDFSTLSLTGTFEVYSTLAQTAALNDTTYDISMSANAWTTISSDASTVNTVRFYASGGRARVNAVRVNGTILVDGSGVNLDILRDAPTNGDQSDTGAGGEVSGNYATWNPLSGFGTLSNGNLENTGSASTWRSRPGTIGMSSGKWYFEWTHNGGSAHLLGIGTSDYPQTNYLGSDTQGWGYYSSNGQKYHNSSSSSYGNSWTTGDVIGVAFDADNGNLYFYKNGTAQNSGTAAYTGLTSGPYFPVISLNGTANTGFVNFGQRAFAYSAPSGYKALCTANLPDPTIADGSDYFNIKTWTGTGSSHAITGYTFAPDFAWIKARNNAGSHALLDTVRGASLVLRSDINSAETNNTSVFSSFDSDGFTLGADTTNGWTNYNTWTYVGWAWDAGSSTASNTDGDITSSVRASQTAGFSIVSYTGSTGDSSVGHGLNTVPEFVICKTRTTADSWVVYHSALNSFSKYLLLDSTAAAGTITDYWGTSSDWTNTTFGVRSTGTGNNNLNGVSTIAYCFAPVAGYSAFGTYTGNGSFTDGPFIYLGFRPAYFLLKSATTGTFNWHVIDSTRSPSNPVDDVLRPNLGNNEVENYGGIKAIFSANGIKLNASWLNVNNSDDTFVYAAFAENPFQANGGLAR